MLLFREIFRSWPTRIAGIILCCVAFVSIFASFILPMSAYTQDVTHLLAGPSASHLLGTDYLGRDNLARLLLGTRISVVGALEAVAVGFILGVVPGVLSVFLQRWPQFFMMRVVDSLLTIPAIVFAIGAVAVFGETQQVAMAAIGVLFAPHFFRVVRASTLNFAKSQYVEVAQLFGATRLRIILTHVWRKVLPTIAVTIAGSLAGAILAVSGLAYLGIGAQPPTPTWGGMLASDMNYLSVNAWGAVIPGIAIVLTVGALGLIADGIRDATRNGVHAIVAVPGSSATEANAAMIERVA